jgi:glycosyltransferase involved in cell wall biosynthesis
MRVLFVHQNFPGQFRHIAAHLAQQPGVEVLAIGRDTAPGLPGVRLLRYKPHRGADQATHPYVRTMEEAVLHGQQVLRLLLDLKGKGYRPDVIVAHAGWGETLYAKDAFPHAKLIHFCEYYYHSHGADANFDPEFPLDINGAARIRTRNALHLLNLENCDLAVTPTKWQHSLHPEAYRDKIQVIHEGIDTDNLKPNPHAELTLPNGNVLKAGMPIVTYVARNLEPYRGFHTFMRALPDLLKQHPTCQVVIVGGDGVSYGSAPKDAPNWRSKLLQENPVDLSRVHFLGKVPYDTYKKVLQVSAVHVYLTYPFVLSWSLLEAMATGCLIVGSDTAPVREVIRDGENGVLVGFFDKDELVRAVVKGLGMGEEAGEYRRLASSKAGGYSMREGVVGYQGTIERQLVGVVAEVVG